MLSTDSPTLTPTYHRISGQAFHSVSAKLPLKSTERTPAPPPPPPPLDLGPLVRAVDRGLQQLDGRLQALFSEIEEECVALSYAAAENILLTEVDRGNYDLTEALQRALDRHRNLWAEKPATLHVHPEDVAALQEAAGAEELLAQVEVVSDPAISRGDLLLQAGATEVVRSLRAELQQLRVALGRPSS
jgi:flagellar biosynthesis/type III secretory pathway protein FliH